MKLQILFCFMLMTGFEAFSQQKTNFTEVRKDMLLAINNAQLTDSLYEDYTSINKKPPLLTAYIGALEALKAKNSWNPYSKVKYLVQSGKTLQKAVDESPENMEIRFVRFSIQYHLPRFLGLNNDMTDDKNVIILQLKQKHYGSADRVFVANIIQFLINSKQCSLAENIFLRSQLADLK